jgi:hypothetical protein
MLSTAKRDSSQLLRVYNCWQPRGIPLGLRECTTLGSREGFFLVEESCPLSAAKKYLLAGKSCTLSVTKRDSSWPLRVY